MLHHLPNPVRNAQNASRSHHRHRSPHNIHRGCRRGALPQRCMPTLWGKWSWGHQMSLPHLLTMLYSRSDDCYGVARSEMQCPKGSFNGRAPHHVLSVASISGDASGEARLRGQVPCGSIVRCIVMTVVSAGMHADGEVTIVAFQGLGLVGTAGAAGTAHIPVLAAILAHEEVEVLAIVSLAVNEA